MVPQICITHLEVTVADFHAEDEREPLRFQIVVTKVSLKRQEEGSTQCIRLQPLLQAVVATNMATPRNGDPVVTEDREYTR
jgi:hypothetical protein